MAGQLKLELGPVLMDNLVEQCRFGPVAYVSCSRIWPCLAILVRAQSHGANKYRQYSFVILPGTMALPSRCCQQYASINVSFLPSLSSELMRRMKKRKLKLKDWISHLESLLIPDLDA